MRKLSLLFLLLLVACSPAQETETPTPAPGAFNYTGIDHSNLGDYHVSYQLSFEGETTWLYLLETRRSGQSVEYLLHIG